MGSSAKQIQTQGVVQESQVQAALLQSSRAKSRRSNQLQYISYGSLERLARILIDIARNRDTDRNQKSNDIGP